MGLIKYSIDGSSLSPSDQEKLIKLLDSWSSTGTTFVDIKNGIYQAMFDESDDVSSIPFPQGTILHRI